MTISFCHNTNLRHEFLFFTHLYFSFWQGRLSSKIFKLCFKLMWFFDKYQFLSILARTRNKTIIKMYLLLHYYHWYCQCNQNLKQLDTSLIVICDFIFYLIFFQYMILLLYLSQFWSKDETRKIYSHDLVYIFSIYHIIISEIGNHFQKWGENKTNSDGRL